MKKSAVTIPNVDLHFIKASTSYSALSLVGRRTSILLDLDLNILQRNIDENTAERYLCSMIVCIKAPHVILGGESGVIKIYNVETGKAYGYMKGHGGSVIGIVGYKNSCILSCSGDTTIRLWDYKRMECMCIFGGYLGHRDYVLSIDVSMDQTYLASSGTDCSIKVWQIPQKPDPVLVYFPVFTSTKIHRSFISCLRFYGELLVSMSKDNRISAVLPLCSENTKKRNVCDDAVFMGDVVVDEKLVGYFTIVDHFLVALTEKMSLVIYDLQLLGTGEKASVICTFISKKPRGFDVVDKELFILCDDSSVLKINLSDYL